MANSSSPNAVRRSVPWTECEQWLETLSDRSAPQDQDLRDLLGRLTDATGHARVKLVLSAVGRSMAPPAEALRQLAEVATVFSASGLLREVRVARCEAAGHLLDLANPDAARWLLMGQATPGADGAPALSLAEEAKLATALLDLWEADAAVAAAGAVAEKLMRAGNLANSRFLRRALMASVDILLAQALADSGRLETCLADGLRSPPAAKHRAAGASPASPVLQAALRALQFAMPGDVAVDSQALLCDSLCHGADVPDRLQALTRRMSAAPRPEPASWLRLCVAYRLLGRPVLAAHCAREALKCATDSGALRMQQKALTEVALIQMDGGQQGTVADTWKRLRTLDHAIKVARREFDGIRTAFAFVGEHDPVLATPVAPRNSRAAHVATAMEQLRADPGRSWRVDTLAGACGVSRRTLEQAFRLERNTSVGDVIREQRIARALHLLRQTDHAVKRVAIDAGFSSSSSLCRELRRHSGLSPKQIRFQFRRSEAAGERKAPAAPAPGWRTR